MENELDQAYYNLDRESAFGASSHVHRNVRDKGIAPPKVKDYLSRQFTHTLHAPARRRFPRRRTIVTHINAQWQIDLVDLASLGTQNKGFKYLLMIIDSFSKKLQVVAIKNKNAKSVADALKTVLRDEQPEVIYSDEGGEFFNVPVKRLLAEKKIHHYPARNKDVKAAIVERVNRTFKGIMFKFMTSIGSRSYIDKLPKFVAIYNNRYHRSIKMTPNQVTKVNEKRVFRNLYGVSAPQLVDADKTRKIKFKVGDLCRTTYVLKPMDKRYLPNWKEAVYTVSRVVDGWPPLYYIKDYRGNELEKRYYTEELQKIGENKYRVEKILKRRGNQVYVKWLNYPKSHNSWELAENIDELEELQ